MRRIQYDAIVQAVTDLCVDAAHRLSPDVLHALQTATQSESDPRAAHVLKLLLENARVAETEQIPLCQDTGVAVVFIEQGNDVFVEGGLFEAVNEGVRRGYEQGYLRKSIVDDPIQKRENTGTNTPAVIARSFRRSNLAY